MAAQATSVEAPILTLPDEVLFEIFQHAIPIKAPTALEWHGLGVQSRLRQYPDPTNKAYRHLALVCRRFNHLATPRLYSDVVLDATSYLWHPSSSEPAGILAATRRLHRTMADNPSLRGLPRAVYFVFPDTRALAEEAMAFALDYAHWFAGARHLYVRGMTVAPDTAIVVRAAVLGMRNLEAVTLDKTKWAESSNILRPTLDAIDSLQRLRSLVVSSNPLPARTVKRGTAAFTRLHVDTCALTGEALDEFVRWPARLDEFYFDFQLDRQAGGGDWAGRPGWSLARLRSILLPHRATLRTLSVGRAPQPGLRGFDLTDFPCLERLALNYWSTMSDTRSSRSTSNSNDEDQDDGSRQQQQQQRQREEEQEEEQRLLLAPRLREFHWSFDMGYFVGSDLGDFGQAQEDWLRGFAAAAARQRTPLDRITVTFGPVAGFPGRLAAEDVAGWTYPWDRLEAVAGDLRAQGIELEVRGRRTPRDKFRRLQEIFREEAGI